MRMYLNFKNERRLNRYKKNTQRRQSKQYYYPGEKEIECFSIIQIYPYIKKYNYHCHRKKEEEKVTLGKKASYLYIYIYKK